MKKKSFSLFNFLIFIILMTFSILLFWMLSWGVISSLKTSGDFTIWPLALPKHGWKFENYVKAFENIRIPIYSDTGTRFVGLLEMFGYSFVFTIGCSLVGTITPCIAAYLVAKYNNKFNHIVYAIVIFTMIVPIVGNLPSMLQVLQALHLYNTIYGVFIMRASFLGLYFLIFLATFKSISWEYAEAAIIDGAGHFKIMFTIMFPLAMNTILTVFILLFMANWNDYQTPLLYMPDFPTAAYGLHIFIKGNIVHGSVQSPPIQLAGGVLLMLPILTVFLIFKDKIMNNISVGGLKG